MVSDLAKQRVQAKWILGDREGRGECAEAVLLLMSRGLDGGIASLRVGLGLGMALCSLILVNDAALYSIT